MNTRDKLTCCWALLMTVTVLSCSGTKPEDFRPEGNSPSDTSSVRPEIVMTISGGNPQYKVVEIDQDPLYTDRAYVVGRNLPARFRGWHMATSPVKVRAGGKMRLDAPGRIYVMTRLNRGPIMDIEGWTIETPDNPDDPDIIRESTETGDPLVIWSRKVRAGQEIDIPQPSDTYFGGFIPIAPSIRLEGAPTVFVRGELLDIRSVAEGKEIYPQHTKLLFADIPAEITGMWYATSLKELRGVKEVACDQPATLLVAVNRTDDIAGWNPTGNTLNIGGRDYGIYSRRYDTPYEWILVPEGDSGQGSPLVFGSAIQVYDPPSVPGTVIAKAARLKTDKVTNPNLVILPDGSYLSSAYGLLGGRGPAFYHSTDRGLTWNPIHGNDNATINFDKVFLVGKVLYQLGTDFSAGNNIVIRKSVDNGVSWSPFFTLFSGENFLAAPTPVTIHDGRVWHAFNTAPVGLKKGTFIISAPVDSDLTDASNWTRSNTITWVYEWQPDSFANWEEGNAIVGPDNRMVIVSRIDESNFVKPLHDRAAIIRVSDPSTIAFDPVNDIVDFPGGGKKFTIGFDSVSKKYWALVNPTLPEDKGKKHSGIYAKGISAGLQRSRLALISSSDLRNWTTEHILISSNNPFFHGFQYLDWVFDGDDIIAVVRTAFEEERGLPVRQHDANLLTFLRVKNFRAAATFNPTIEIRTEGLD